ncbi:uncharacterized protein LOC115775437, partial [Archocentrus centrarchus]|uniref:uncharacterized protein LOC115775437 n=1 Tax=Archocentrus centrarchus TaxID=63155 RepID=UPI0011EA3D32
MPRKKSYLRSQAAKKRMAEQLAVPVRPLRPKEKPITRHGTGFRHAVSNWRKSAYTGKSHKLVLPPDCREKKFVLIVGDSHLRHFVDGHVPLPEGCLSFGISSTPGATASELEKEIVNIQLDRTPSLVVLIAPSNNLTASRTVTEAAADFGRYVATVASRWTKVCVLDFPRRLTVDLEVQNHLSQEYHRVAARLGVKYFSVAEFFPMDNLDLWARDGVHLSDSDGMKILGDLLWNVSFQEVSEILPPPSPPLESVRSSQPVRKVTPRLVVTGPTPLPVPPPSEWTVVGQGKKKRTGSPILSPGDTKRSVLQQHQVEPVFSIPLTSACFSPEILKQMDKEFPSDLDSVEYTASFPAGKKVPRERRQKAVACKKSLPEQQEEAAASIVEVNAGSSTSSPPEMVPGQVDVEVVGETCAPPTSSVVFLDTVEDKMKMMRGPRQRTQRAAKRRADHGCICCEKVSVVDGKGDAVDLLFGVDQTQLDKTIEGDSDSVASLPHNIRGSFHQGSLLMANPGVQCMANALLAIGKNKMHSVFLWHQEDLDKTLRLGDALYSSLRAKGKITPGSELLIVPNLPRKWDIDGVTLKFHYGDCVSGVVDVNTGELIDSGVLVSLETGLNRMLEHYTTLLFTLCGNTCAIISETGKYAVVDSHARGPTGLVDSQGTSVVVYFRSIRQLVTHFKRLFGKRGSTNKSFEITGVNVDSDSQSGPVEHATFSEIKLTRGTKVSDNEADVVCVGVEVNNMHYSPLTQEICKVLCNSVNVEFEKFNATAPSTSFPLGVPCLKESIAFDGNCYFRAISQAISGTQKNHRKIRLAVVKQLERNYLKYQSFLRDGFSSVQNYISETKMRNVNSWATELEIQVTADYFGIDVFTFLSDRWVKYSCSTKLLSTQAIYLQNHGNHYETVICVKEPNSQNCYCFCKSSECHASGYNIRSKIQSQHLDDSLTRVTTSKIRRSKYLDTKIKVQKKVKYQEDGVFNEICQQKNRLNFKYKYQQQKEYKLMCIKKSKEKYQNDLAHKETVKIMSKEKYRTNCSHREKLKALIRDKYKKNDSYKEKMKREKYQKNDSYKEKIKALIRDKYKKNDSYKEKMKALIRDKYKKNDSYKEKMKALIRDKYKKNDSYKEKMKALSIEKNCKNDSHKQKMKALMRQKYQNNESYKERKKAVSKEKYQTSDSHRQNIKEHNVKQYKNISFRAKVKEFKKTKYHKNREYRKDICEKGKLRRTQFKNELKNFEVVMRHFLEKVETGTEFVCCVCYRLFFKKQVLKCNKDCYRGRQETSEMADKCISDKYLHKCNMECNMPCEILATARGELWICYSCHYKIKKAHMPPECYINNLELDDIPEDLRCLNSLEQHLIAPHIAFMKLLALPKGGQNGVHGPITCVPANVAQTTNLLPRLDMDGSLLRVKLKRKLTYKGYYKYQFVDSNQIKQALRYLKRVNKYFKDINFNEAWLNEFVKEQGEDDIFNQETIANKDQNVDGDLNEKTEENDEDAPETAGVDELLHDRQQHCMFQDTCLMPVDIGQEVLDQYFEDVLNLAPAEGNNPIKLLSDKENEAKCFPVLFPKGRNTYHERRPHYLTLSRYFNNRIMHADGRFAQNLEYIFFAQYMSEVQQVISNVSIALRKGQTNNVFHKQCDKQFKTKESLKNLLEFDDGYRFLKPIRGTPAFWQTAQSNLLAMVRQLSVPTWFCSFSSADLRWQNLLKVILIQEGRRQTVEDLEWSERCELLRQNPVTAARMFDYRWHVFLKEVLI